MAQTNKELKQLTPELKKIKEETDKRSGQLVCSIMMFALGFITSPKLLSIALNKNRYPEQFQVPNLLTYFAVLSGYLFILVLCTIFLRVFTGNILPAEHKDPASITSINQLIKNSIFYSFCFLGMYFHAIKKWQKPGFDTELLPFIFLGTLIFEFGLRLLELILEFKGIRYLSQSITIFLVFLIAIETIQ